MMLSMLTHITAVAPSCPVTSAQCMLWLSLGKTSANDVITMHTELAFCLSASSTLISSCGCFTKREMATLLWPWIHIHPLSTFKAKKRRGKVTRRHRNILPCNGIPALCIHLTGHASPVRDPWGGGRGGGGKGYMQFWPSPLKWLVWHKKRLFDRNENYV